MGVGRGQSQAILWIDSGNRISYEIRESGKNERKANTFCEPSAFFRVIRSFKQIVQATGSSTCDCSGVGRRVRARAIGAFRGSGEDWPDTVKIRLDTHLKGI